MPAHGLSWTAIARLGVAQACLGAIVVLATSTFNRVMVVELALPASVPGALVALHYAMQALRPRLGHGADAGGRCTPWIVGGMATLAAGAVLASTATAWMGETPVLGFALAAAGFALIGLGVGAAGTSLLVLLATRTRVERRPAAATIVWILMIAGFAISAGAAGRWLDPYTPSRLVAVTACVAAIAFVLSALAIHGIERAASLPRPQAQRGEHPPFRVALTQVWSEPSSRRLATFIFVSMLAYGSQDLILEPFAGAVFGLTPGQSTSLAGLQHGGTLAGMIAVGLVATLLKGRGAGSLRGWTIAGCLASSAALAALAAGGIAGPSWPLPATVAALGVANGVYAIAAVGLMLSLVAAGREAREGVRMGVWGAAQAVAFGAGGLAGTVAVDLARHALGRPDTAYVAVFAAEATLFAVSAWLASRVRPGTARSRTPAMPGEPAPAR